MTTAFPPCLNRWKTLYTAAILETNQMLLPQRVSQETERSRKGGTRAKSFTETEHRKKRKPWKTHSMPCVRSEPLGSIAKPRDSVTW